ncbi:YqzE family protein [Lentibacillus sediminis]|uniref:YqzE family protein n=1 Tax=Lentibacillus sediminis TaxID=1940529 RepID=UPI001EFEE1C9|nr:YqzE family protein [Lentibacillus sediminis]
MISGNEYVRFVTEQVMTYIHLPSEERKNRRQEQKNKRPVYANKWLGVLPFAFRTYWKKAE